MPPTAASFISVVMQDEYIHSSQVLSFLLPTNYMPTNSPSAFLVTDDSVPPDSLKSAHAL